MQKFLISNGLPLVHFMTYSNGHKQLVILYGWMFKPYFQMGFVQRTISH